MKKQRITEEDYLKAHRRASREEEIARHGRPAVCRAVHKSKKTYDRKREKAGLRNLPFPFHILRDASQGCAGDSGSPMGPGCMPSGSTGAGRAVTMLSTMNFVNPRQGSAPKYSR